MLAGYLYEYRANARPAHAPSTSECASALCLQIQGLAQLAKASDEMTISNSPNKGNIDATASKQPEPAASHASIRRSPSETQPKAACGHRNAPTHQEK